MTTLRKAWDEDDSCGSVADFFRKYGDHELVEPRKYDAKAFEKKDAARIYPCADCGKMRSKEEGGTTFTCCDECWDKAYPPMVMDDAPIPVPADDETLTKDGEVEKQPEPEAWADLKEWQEDWSCDPIHETSNREIAGFATAAVKVAWPEIERRVANMITARLCYR